MATTDEVVAIIAPHLGERLMLVLPDGNDDRIRIVDSSLEARIWKGKREVYIYEIASCRSGAILARGEATTAYQALERSIPLLLLLHERSGAIGHAA